MALPILKQLVYSTTLPLSKKKIKFRPYTVKDEKILLIASTSKNKDPQFYLDNISTVIKNCIVETEIEYEKMLSVDVEYLLLQLRAKSVGETVDLSYTNDAGEKEDISLNLEEFKVDVDPEHLYTIELTPEVGLKMKDLLFVERINYGSKYNDDNKAEVIYDTIIDSVVSIYDESNVYVIGQDTTKEELRVFIEGLAGVSGKLYQFIQTMPQLSVEATLKSGEKKTFTSSDFDFLALSSVT